MTALLAVHAMSTPGVLIGANGVIAFAGGLGIPVGTGLLALTALPALRRTRNVKPLLALQLFLAVLVLALAAIAVASPAWVPKVPTAGSDAAYGLLACGLSFCVLLTHRATRTFWLTRRPADLLVAVGCIWLGVALVAQLVIGPMTLGYYLGHALELILDHPQLETVCLVPPVLLAGVDRAQVGTVDQPHLGIRPARAALCGDG